MSSTANHLATILGSVNGGTQKKYLPNIVSAVNINASGKVAAEQIQATGIMLKHTAVPTAITSPTTATGAQLVGGLFTNASGATCVFNLPISANIAAALGGDPVVGSTFSFTVISTAASSITTVTAATGVTLVGGSASVAAEVSATFQVRCVTNDGLGTATSTTWVCYRS